MISLTSSQNQLLAQLMDLHTDEIRSVLAKLGLDVDFALTPQENYSEKTRKRAYWPRVQTAFREIAEDYREEYFAKLTEVLLDQKLSPETPEITEVVENNNAAVQDRRFARIAIEEARKSIPENDGRAHPLVGAVVIKNGQVLATAHRGEAQGNHAEFIALEKKLLGAVIAGSTVYTTLEPCTTRNHPKVPCAERLIERKVARVVIGMLDPDPRITGRGQRKLRSANIITDFFPHDLMTEVEELNREFTRAVGSENRVPLLIVDAPRVIPDIVRQERNLGEMYDPQPQPIILSNRGKWDALVVQLQPIVLTQGQAHFRQLPILSPGEKKPIEVEIRGPGSGNVAKFIPPSQRGEFHNLEFLFQAEWDSRNDLALDMMRCPFSISYSDPNKQQFLTNGVFVYYPHGGEIEVAELEFKSHPAC